MMITILISSLPYEYINRVPFWAGWLIVSLDFIAESVGIIFVLSKLI